MWGKRREAEPEHYRDAAVQKFFAPFAPAEEAPAQAAFSPAGAASEAQPTPLAGLQANDAAAQPVAAAESATPAPEQAPRLVRANPVSTAFGDMVALLAKSPAHKHSSLADLQWLLLPPVALNQFALADATLQNGQTVLAGFVLWARVAPDVDARLTQNRRYPVRLQPSEWRSGEIFWIIDAVGHPNAVKNIISQLTKNTLGERQFKLLKVKHDLAGTHE